MEFSQIIIISIIIQRFEKVWDIITY